MTNVHRFLALLACCALLAGAAASQAAGAQAAGAQAKVEFEVASIKPSAPLDAAKMAASIQSGQMPKIGAQVTDSQASFTYMSLRELIIWAYSLKPYQVNGPDWLASERFDIIAKLPDGAHKEQAPEMLQALLADRFKLVVHRESKERPVLALVVGKNGPKLKQSAVVPKPLDDTAPLGPGEMNMSTAQGPARMTIGQNGGASIDMGEKGTMRFRVDPSTMTMHLDGQGVTMDGFADMLTQFGQMQAGAATADRKQIVDMTNLKGYYDVTLDFSLADLLNMARAAGVNMPAGVGAPGAPTGEASEPSGTSSLTEAVKAMGLNLENRSAVTDQLVVDSIEKTPTEN
jgi:uncharacterized protein (TIGR03435 family)